MHGEDMVGTGPHRGCPGLPSTFPVAGLIGAGGAKPIGVSLRRAEDEVWADLLDGEGATLLSLGPFGPGECLVRGRALAAASGLPLLGDPGGASSTLASNIAPGRRRRLVVLTGRRPRFLVRRKTGRWPRRPLVYREREMARGRGA